MQEKNADKSPLKPPSAGQTTPTGPEPKKHPSPPPVYEEAVRLPTIGLSSNPLIVSEAAQSPARAYTIFENVPQGYMKKGGKEAKLQWMESKDDKERKSSKSTTKTSTKKKKNRRSKSSKIDSSRKSPKISFTVRLRGDGQLQQKKPNTAFPLGTSAPSPKKLTRRPHRPSPTLSTTNKQLFACPKCKKILKGVRNFCTHCTKEHGGMESMGVALRCTSDLCLKRFTSWSHEDPRKAMKCPRPHEYNMEMVEEEEEDSSDESEGECSNEESVGEDSEDEELE